MRIAEIREAVVGIGKRKVTKNRNYARAIALLDAELLNVQRQCRHPRNHWVSRPDPSGPTVGWTECGVCGDWVQLNAAEGGE